MLDKIDILAPFENWFKPVLNIYEKHLFILMKLHMLKSDPTGFSSSVFIEPKQEKKFLCSLVF